MKLSRRKVLGAVLAAPVAVMAATRKPDMPEWPSFEAPVVYKGWKIWEWTGWKPSQETDVLVGQWLAYKGRAKSEWRYLYTSAPGSQGEYERGGLFDITPQKGQKVIMWPSSSKADKEEAKREAYDRMIRLIDSKDKS